MATPLVIGGHEFYPGENRTIDLPAGELYTHTPLTLPVHVIRGKRPGPRLLVCAAIHGDEINGVEIIRRLLSLPLLKSLRGDLVAVPIVNVPGFLHRSRYLPDRRDLNRSFPGSDRGSLAGRLAHLFLSEIVAQCNYGIDLHTAAIDRANLPQVRANMDDPVAAAMAEAFLTPVMLNAPLRPGSIREAAANIEVPFIVYECGEALRFDEPSIRTGLQGTVRVMRHLGMLPASKKRRKNPIPPVLTQSSSWVRAAQSGILRSVVPLGARVEKHETLGFIADPFGEQELEVLAPAQGIIIGRSTLPLVYQGEAMFHLAKIDKGDMELLDEIINEDNPMPPHTLLPDEPIIV